MKIICWILGVIVFLVIAGFFYLRITCQAIEKLKTHSGITTYRVVSRNGNEHEPANCKGIPFIISEE